MRAFRMFALAAALIAPAAAAHAQFGMYVGPSAPYAAPAYGEGGYWVPGHWSYGPAGRFWLGAQWMPQGGYYGNGREWREHRGWGHDGWRDRQWARHEWRDGRRW